MDPNYPDTCRQGYYGNRDREHPENRLHQPLQQQQQSQQAPHQHVPNYSHQLPYHPGLIVSSQQQPRFTGDLTEQRRSRDEFHAGHGSPSMMRSIFAGTGPVQPGSTVLLPQQSYSSREQHISHLHPMTQSNLTPPRTEQVNTASHTEQSSGRACLTPPSARQSDCAERRERESASSDVPGIEPVRGQAHHQRDNHVHSHNRSADEATKLVLQEKQLNALCLRKKSSKRKAPSASSSVQLPTFLCYKYASGEKENIEGVITKEEVDKGTEFGPYEGSLMDEELGIMKETTWELCLRGKVFFYVSGIKKDQRNWMSYVKGACNEEEMNVEAFQYYGEIYFRTTKVIESGSELRVCYSEEYASHAGFKTELNDLNYSEDAKCFQCTLCDSQQSSGKQMLRHLKLEHNSEHVHEMLPVVTWRMRGKKTEENANSKEGSHRVSKKLQENDESKKETKLGEFTCLSCGKNFQSEGRLKAHQLFHEYSEEHACPICGERQLNAHTLTKHVARHDARPHRCGKCDKTYKSKAALYRHDRDAHGRAGSREHRCKFCSVMFAKKSARVAHEKTHGKSKVVKEASNSKGRSARVLLCTGKQKAAEEENRESETEGELELEEKPRPAEGTDQQAVPDTVRSTRRSKLKANPSEPKDMLGKAVDYYSKPRPYKCRYCSKRYCYRKIAYEHEKEVHEGKGMYKCSFCPRVFMNENRFLDHVKCHEQNRMYRCSLCPRTFASESALSNHQGEHTGLKPFKCEICGRGFRVRKAVYEHKRRMHQARAMRFFCSFCSKGFAEKGALTKHERRHKGIRPFVCLTCGKGFTEKCALTAHIQCLHTEVKPFSCPICGKSFSLNQNFTYHMFKHKAQGEDVPADSSMAEMQ